MGAFHKFTEFSPLTNIIDRLSENAAAKQASITAQNSALAQQAQQANFGSPGASGGLLAALRGSTKQASGPIAAGSVAFGTGPWGTRSKFPTATIKSKGGATGTVHANLAPVFQSLINDIEAAGIPIKTLSTYRPGATVKGTGSPSQHGAGAAIDINASVNPVGSRSGGQFSPQLIAQLKAKYPGLSWGGDFRSGSSAYDAMHFSFKTPIAGGR